ncbi:hypothetical protein BGZ67_010761, partial [Mortierella alpina]
TDNIKLGQKIGSGAQAEVFKAKCELDDVVVKRFLDTTHKNTKQEVEIIKRLTHRHIVQFYYVHHDMLVMEYVEGGSLADVIVGRGLMSWEVKMQIAKDISLGLAYLHYRGIIHCDIKSSNILLTQHKEARICDFGLAMRVGEIGGGGTLQWMAPELLQPLPQFSSKSDVYALGMVMWEMASGSTQPYKAHTPQGIIYCIQHGISEEVPDDTPKDYADCVQSCWKHRPHERPAAEGLLLDTERSSSSHGHDERQPRGPVDTNEKTHYLEALKQFFHTSHSPGFTDLFTSGNMLYDNSKAMDWFESSSRGNETARACLKLGGMYYFGSGMEQDYGKALEWYRAASEAGIAVAMLQISHMYRHGQGVDQDSSEAASWYHRAEEAMEAQDAFSHRMVHHDASVSEHHNRTMKWFIDSVSDGAITTKTVIGDMYREGQHLKQDHDKALEWYLKASAAGDGVAMRRIGNMYHNGHGTDQDYSKALKWFLKANDTGNAGAMNNIGNMHYNGQGVEKDYGKAMEWYLRASDAGAANAMGSIGIIYEKGQGVEQDYAKAME